MSKNLITLDITGVNFNSPKFKIVGGLTLDKVKIKYNWIFNANIKDAIIGEDDNGLVWFSGTWINGTWENGTWLSGTFLNGRWKNGNVYSLDIDLKQSLNGILHINRVDISKTHFVNCTFEGGIFNYGIFGNIKNIDEISLPYEISLSFVINNIKDNIIDNGFNSGIKPNSNIKIGFDDKISNFVSSIVFDDDNIYVSGQFSSYNNYKSNNIIKLNNDGTIDTSYNNYTEFNYKVNVMKIDNDGKLLIGGNFTSYNEIDAPRIIRLNKDGSEDTTFHYGQGFDDEVNTIDIDSKGNIFIGGKFTSYNDVFVDSIVKLSPNGEIDLTFTRGSGFNGDVNIIKIDKNDKILVGGNFNNYKDIKKVNNYIGNIIRLNNDGTVDIFNVIDTTLNNINTGFNKKVNSIDIDSYDNIIIGGDFTTYNNLNNKRLVKLNPNGSIYEQFNIMNGFNKQINTIKIDSNNKILVGGDFTSFNNKSINYIIRLNIDGSSDESFTNEKFNNKIRDISININNKILVGGDFTSYDNIFQNYLIRLNKNGSVNINNNKFYDDKLKTTVFLGGDFNGGLFNSAYFKNGNFKNGIINNSIWDNGKFYNGVFLDGEWNNGEFYGGDFSNGNWHNGMFSNIDNKKIPKFGLNYKNKKSNCANWYNGMFSIGQFHSGINETDDIIYPSIDNTLVNWYGGTFNNGEWYGGTFNNGTFNNGIWNGGVINNIIFNNGHIMDVICKGGIFNNGNISGGLFDNVIFNNINLGYEIY